MSFKERLTLNIAQIFIFYSSYLLKKIGVLLIFHAQGLRPNS